jgi:crossover junction endodeoxyribonuclease RuvC
MPTRLSRISTGLQELIVHHRPDRVAIEDVFYATNVKSALKLGQVRGVAMLAAASAGLEVAEYSPLSIKSAVVGYGRAEKHQVQQMVARLLNLDEIPQPSDAADALAIAICHLHTAATRDRQGSERSGLLPDVSVVASSRLSRASSTVAPGELPARKPPAS